MNKIKLILSDLDGTLFDSNGQVSDESLKVIKKVKEKGLLFGIATGRSTADIEGRLQPELVNLLDVVIGSNGYEVKDYNTGETIYGKTLPKYATKEIMKMLEGIHCNLFFGDKHGLICTYDHDIIDDILGKEGNPTYYSNENFCNLDIPKLCVIFYETNLEKIKGLTNRINKPDYYGSQTAPIVYEYQHKTTSKYQGIKRYIDKNNITNNEILAFGDAGNDFDMISNVGFGVTMINGSEDILEIADDITQYNNNESGVAKYILKNILKEDVI